MRLCLAGGVGGRAGCHGEPGWVLGPWMRLCMAGKPRAAWVAAAVHGAARFFFLRFSFFGRTAQLWPACPCRPPSLSYLLGLKQPSHMLPGASPPISPHIIHHVPSAVQSGGAQSAGRAAGGFGARCVPVYGHRRQREVSGTEGWCQGVVAPRVLRWVSAGQRSC